MHSWDEIETLLWDLAADDLAQRAAVRPTLVGFREQRALLLSRCRPFDAEDGEAALTEVLDVMVPMGADRVALLFAGWARVTDGAAPRRRRRDATSSVPDVTVITCAERVGPVVSQRGALRTIRRTGGAPPTVTSTSIVIPVSGWIAQALSAGLLSPHADTVDDQTIIARAARCITLGHELHVPDRAGDPPVRRASNMRSAHTSSERGDACATLPARARFDTRR